MAATVRYVPRLRCVGIMISSRQVEADLLFFVHRSGLGSQRWQQTHGRPSGLDRSAGPEAPRYGFIQLYFRADPLDAASDSRPEWRTRRREVIVRLFCTSFKPGIAQAISP